MFVWWFSTGAILWLVRRPEAGFRRTLAIGGGLAAVATAVIVVGARDDSVAAAYVGFAAALVVWGWHEASFLMGLVTGPRPEPCPPGARGWSRFRYATLTVLHHEIALVVTAAAVVGLTWGQPNQIASWTFLILLAMRLSAKFNIFLGVPNLTDEFFPDHLAHLKSYLPKRPMNALFPFSVAGSVALGALLLERAIQAPAGSGESVGFILLFTLTALALIEHAFMILPLPDAALWRWAVPERPVGKAPPLGSTLGDPVPANAPPAILCRPTEAPAHKDRPATTAAKD